MVHVAETTTNRRHAGFFIRFVGRMTDSHLIRGPAYPSCHPSNAEHAQRVFDTIRSSPLPISRSAATAAAAQGQQAKGAPAAAGAAAAAAKPAGYAARTGAAPNGTGKPAAAGRPGGPNAWGNK